MTPSSKPAKTTTVDALRRRLLDGSRRGDYLLAFAFACVPVALSWFLGIGWSVLHGEDCYTGYLRSQWRSFVVIVPLTLFAFREVMARLLEPRGDCHYPPVIGLMSKSAQEGEMASFWETVASRRSLVFAAIAALAITAVDVRETLSYYVQHWTQTDALLDPREKNWGVFFVTGRISPALNLPFVLLAYSVQALVLLLAIWLVCLFANHNRYFLRSIYRRRLAGNAPRDNNIIVNLRSGDACFGFIGAHRAFNTQVFCLVIGGMVMLVSRYPNTRPSVTAEAYAFIERLASPGFSDAFTLLLQIGPAALRHSDIGQWMLVVAWLVAVLVVAMPGLVKFLPILDMLRGGRDLTAVNYLREIIPERALGWENVEPTRDEIEVQLTDFASNAFWPAGDWRAAFLFVFAFVVLGCLLAPVRYEADHAFAFFTYAALLTLAAIMSVAVLFLFAHMSLWYIDSRLTGKMFRRRLRLG